MTTREDAYRRFAEMLVNENQGSTIIYPLTEDAIQFADLADNGEGILDENETLEERIIRQERQEEIKAAIRSLSLDQQNTIVAIFYENMTVEEAATKFGVHRNTVRNRLNNALANLRKLVHEN